MEFFKKMFKAESPKNKIDQETNPKILDVIQDQSEIGGGLTDVSLGDYTNELNDLVKQREIIGKEEKVVAETSGEEEKRDAELGEKIEALRLKFVSLREEIKERQIIINELRQTKYGAEQSAKNLNWKEMVSKERNMVATEMMRTAEDRIERLKVKIERNQIELTPLIQELDGIEEIINSLTELIKVEIKNEKDEVVTKGYDFSQN